MIPRSDIGPNQPTTQRAINNTVMNISGHVANTNPANGAVHAEISRRLYDFEESALRVINGFPLLAVGENKVIIAHEIDITLAKRASTNFQKLMSIIDTQHARNR